MKGADPLEEGPEGGDVASDDQESLEDFFDGEPTEPSRDAGGSRTLRRSVAAALILLGTALTMAAIAYVLWVTGSLFVLRIFFGRWSD